METNEIETLVKLKRLTAQYFTTLKPTTDKNSYVAQFKVVNYLELGCVITDMLKLCILALDHNMHNINEMKHESINVSLILETVVQMLPLNEFEYLSYVGEMVSEEYNIAHQ